MLTLSAPSASSRCRSLSARYSRSRCCVPETPGQLIPSVTERLFLKMAELNLISGQELVLWDKRVAQRAVMLRVCLCLSFSGLEVVLCLSHSNLIPFQCILQRFLAVVYSVTKIFCLPIQFQNRNRKPNRGYRWEQQLNRAG